jgi:TRAP-type C4-dicarboxylate transport system permease small subunit
MYKFLTVLSLLITGLIRVTPVYAQEDVTKIQTFIQNVIQILVTFGGLLAAGFFVYGGIRYITSSGNPESLDQAKKTILYSAIGLVIVLGAFVLSNSVSQVSTAAFGSTQ